MDQEQAAILIVDDEFAIRDSLSNWFHKDGLAVQTADSGERALEIVAQQHVDVALVDIKMPGIDGIQLQERLQQSYPEIAVIIITAYATAETAIRALKNGAFDYVTKPIDPDEISHLVNRALEQQRLRRENIQLRETIDELVTVDEIVGKSPALRKVLELVHHVAQTDATVLIKGESGTGKELIARAIHANSK
ncbi:MAG: sigma-54-dependent transcriptional regulator, partial [Phycisphaerales bacterium JB038]